jgi:F-type H+-transporting ATPase subunit epsilon
MSRVLHLTISTPNSVVVDEAEVAAIRARDESGSFGILPGHTDLLTVLPASVVRWRDRQGQTHYCAVRSGVLRIADGTEATIACREAIPGNRLQEMEAAIEVEKSGEEEADRKARVAQMRLHTHAIRQLLHYLAPQGQGDRPSIFSEDGA